MLTKKFVTPWFCFISSLEAVSKNGMLHDMPGIPGVELPIQLVGRLPHQLAILPHQ